MTNEKALVPNRDCGECTVCCKSLRIDTPELKKRSDVPCPHLSPVKGCSIYDSRPQVCRNWYCGWRIMPFLGDDMRPDRAKVLIKIDGSKFTFMPIERDGASNLLAMNVMNALATLVSGDVKVQVSVPTRPGYTNSLAPVNDALKPSLKTMDFEEGIKAMNNVIFFASRTLTLQERD